MGLLQLGVYGAAHADRRWVLASCEELSVETSTQVPSNLGQAVLASYLSDDHWGITGFIRWQWAVRLEYQAKRDFLLDCLAKYVPKELVTTTPCGGGMFQFLEVAISTHPRFARTPLPSETDAVAVPLDLTSEPRLGAETNPEVPGLGKKSAGEVEYTTNTGELMDELWKYCIDEGGVLLMPAKLFQVVKPGVDQTHRLNFFRATVGPTRELRWGTTVRLMLVAVCRRQGHDRKGNASVWEGRSGGSIRRCPPG